MQVENSLKPLVYGFCAAFFWGTHSVIVRYLTGDMHGITIAALRLYIAAIALFVLMKLLRFPISLRLSDRNLQIAVSSTVLNYICFHIGLEHTSASNAMMLENTAPFFVLLILLVFTGERIKYRDLLAALIAMAGVFLTVYHDFRLGGEGMQGDVLEIFAGLTWAGFIIGSSRALRASADTAERLNFLFNVFVCSAIILTPLMLSLSGHRDGQRRCVSCHARAAANSPCLLPLVRSSGTRLGHFRNAAVYIVCHIHIHQCRLVPGRTPDTR